MKRVSILLYFLLLICTINIDAQEAAFEQAVQDAVRRQLATYPASTLKDLYKNFFQDKFGPGHIIADPDMAAHSLKREIDSMGFTTGEDIEPTGWEGNFYRVNLLLIKEEVIHYEIFFDAFVRSVNSIQPVTIEEWQKEWNEIEKIISTMNLPLDNYREDKTEIENRFDRGEYVGHHSEVFELNYSPHYRIISRDIFEKELRKFLPD